MALESYDGQFVYYHDYWNKREGVWRVPVSGGERTLVVDAALPSPFDWDLTERGIYFIDRNSRPLATICFYDFEARRQVIRTPFHVDPRFLVDIGLDVSPDCEWLLYCGGFSTSDIMMIDNFC